MRGRLLNLILEDPKSFFLTGDMGYNYVEPLAKTDKYLNCGVMEQTMVGVACGLADEGYTPYVYSTVNFLLFRAYEQIRNDVAYGNRNVKLLGHKGSDAYKKLGFTHNFEEGAVERLLGHLNIEIVDNLKDLIKPGPKFIII